METIKFKNGGDRHVYFENGFIVCVETGIKSKLAECYKNFDEWLEDVRFEAAIGTFNLK